MNNAAEAAFIFGSCSELFGRWAQTVGGPFLDTGFKTVKKLLTCS